MLTKEKKYNEFLPILNKRIVTYLYIENILYVFNKW